MINIIKSYFIESPLFEIITEDGPGSSFNLQIVAEAADGTKYTFNQTFESWEKDQAKRFAVRVESHGIIDSSRWHEGTSWDHYTTPQTYSEEKLEAQWKGYA